MEALKLSGIDTRTLRMIWRKSYTSEMSFAEFRQWLQNTGKYGARFFEARRKGIVVAAIAFEVYDVKGHKVELDLAFEVGPASIVRALKIEALTVLGKKLKIGRIRED